ncbi:MAG: hypothetical protein ACP5I8_06370 [Phycisphaerae bacterium]
MIARRDDLKEVLRQVDERLAREHPQGYKLKTVASGSRQDDDWWYILVRPDRKNVDAFDYASCLAKVEQELADTNPRLKVLLIPVCL